MVRKMKELADYGGDKKVINAYQFDSARSDEKVSFTCQSCGEKKKSLKRSLVKRLKAKRKIYCEACKFEEH